MLLIEFDTNLNYVENILKYNNQVSANSFLIITDSSLLVGNLIHKKV